MRYEYLRECQGCYRQHKQMACFIADALKQKYCPCRNCLLKMNCSDVCDERKDMIEIFNKEIQENIYDKRKRK